MFDQYRPIPEISCPVCGTSSLEWQGKDGPCALFVWVEGHAAPVEQMASDDCKLSPGELDAWRLPERFEMFSDCGCPTPLGAVGFAEEGVWTRTELLSPGNAVAYPDESERQFRRRLAGYAEHPGHVG